MIVSKEIELGKIKYVLRKRVRFLIKVLNLDSSCSVIGKEKNRNGNILFVFFLQHSIVLIVLFRL